MPRRPINKRMPGRLRAGPPTSAVSMGSMGYGSGGPIWSDSFRSKRAPTPTELVNDFRSLAYVCVRLNANGVARVPLRLYARTGPRDRKPRRDCRSLKRRLETYLRGHETYRAMIGSGDEVAEVLDHPFLDALRRPNPFFDGHQFLMYMAMSLDVVGSAYFNPVRPNDDPAWASSEWWPLHPQYVQVKKGIGAEVLAGYTYFTQTFQPFEVVRMRALSMRDPYLSGYGPLQAMYEQVGLGNLYFATLEDIIDDGAQLGLLASPAKPEFNPGEVERKRYQADLNNSLTRGNKGRVLVTNGAYKFTQYTMAGTDLADLEISKEARLYVANAFDIPASMLQNEDSNRAVAEAGNYQHQRNAIEPRCVMIASALTAMAQLVDRRLFFAFDNPVEDDKERTAKIVDMQLANGSKTINEVRADEGDEEVKWGKEPWLSNTLIQPSDAAAAREHSQGLAEKMAEKPEPDGDEEPDPPAEKGQAEGDRAFWKTFFAARDALDEGADDKTQRELFERLSRALDRIENSPDAANSQARSGHPVISADLDPPIPAADSGAGGTGGEAEHLRPAGWDADREAVEELVPQADEARPGGDADPGDGTPGPLPAAGEL